MMSKVIIPDCYKCTKCMLLIDYDDLADMECGQCEFKDWVALKLVPVEELRDMK
jgi:hypothetical protein